MPAVSQAQFKFFQANRKRLGDKLADEYTEGVDYKKLPATAKRAADWGSYIAPIGGAVAGGLLGHLFRSRQDEEEGNWTPALMGAGLGLGAGLLGNYALGAHRDAQAQELAQNRASLVDQTAHYYGGGVEHGQPVVAGRALNPEQAAGLHEEMQGRLQQEGPMGPPNPAHARALAPVADHPGGTPMYTLARTAPRYPGGREGHLKWAPSTPSGAGDFKTLQDNASQADRLGLPDVAAAQGQLGLGALAVNQRDNALAASTQRARSGQ